MPSGTAPSVLRPPLCWITVRVEDLARVLDTVLLQWVSGRPSHRGKRSFGDACLRRNGTFRRDWEDACRVFSSHRACTSLLGWPAGPAVPHRVLELCEALGAGGGRGVRRSSAATSSIGGGSSAPTAHRSIRPMPWSPCRSQVAGPGRSAPGCRTVVVYLRASTRECAKACANSADSTPSRSRDFGRR